ncbi:MAG TPA: hypothetical protein PK771_09755 [Spirochaetota bacterium]|nr:hypothetical protein [Spirochaetota bacterium]
MVLMIINCHAENNSTIIWHKKTPIGAHYIFQIGKNINCWGIQKGGFSISQEGKISNEVTFKKEDLRSKIANLKSMQNIGTFAYRYVNDKEIWIVKINQDFTYTDFVKIPDQYYQQHIIYTNFLVSSRIDSYIIFSFSDGYILRPIPNIWYSITGQKLKELDNPDMTGKIYYIDGVYYYDFCSFDKDGKNLQKINLYKQFKISRNYGSIGGDRIKDLPITDTPLNYFIYGDDKFFYVLLRNYKEPKYLILKLDKNYELIGKRTIQIQGNFKERLMSGILVDENGYIYVSSDKEKTITKYVPIEKGEDRFINLNNEVKKVKNN